MNTRRMTLAAAFIAAAIPALAAAREALMPPDLGVRLHIPDVTGLSDVMRTSPAGRCWSDPTVQDFLRHPDFERWLPHHGAATHQRGEIRHLQMEQLRLLRGELVFGVRINTASGADDIYAAAQISAEDYARSLELDRRIAELIPESINILREEFQGVEIWRTTRAANATTNITWQALAQDTALESTDRAWVESNIAALQTRPPQTKQPADFLLKIRLDGGWLRNALEKVLTPKTSAPDGAPAQPPAQPLFKPGDLVDALKISELREITFTLSGASNRLQTALRINNQRCRQGIWTLIDTAPLPISMQLPHVPADTFSYNAGRIDPAGFLNALPEMLSRINPAFAASQQFFQGMLQQSFGVDLHGDILRHLDTAYVSFSRMDNDRAANMLCWRLKEPAAVTATLRRLLADAAPLRMQLGEKFSAADFRGFQLYTFTSPNAADSPWSLAVAGPWLTAGDDTLVRAILRGMDGSAAAPEFYQSPIFQALRAQSPADACGYGLVDIPAVIQTILANPQIQKWRKQCGKIQMRMNAGDEEWAGPDFDRLPPPAKIAAFFGPLLSFSRPTDDGFESINIWQAPPME